MKKYSISILVLLVITTMVSAQTDSLLFRNGNYMVGEVKSMDKNVVTVKTKYSDSDFKIKWHRIQEIYTDTYFLITLTDGSRYNGTIMAREPGRVTILTDERDSIEVNLIDIVYLDDLDKGFWRQINFSIDMGINLTKANNFQQFTTNTVLGYTAKRWNIRANYNVLFSKQDSTEDIQRQDATISYRYFLPKDWYPLISASFLSNTEQLLDLRATWKIGMGKYMVHTNKAYLGFSAGTNYNNEQFTGDGTVDRQSWEGFMGAELNMFNIGDLDLLTNLVAYPSMTEQSRWRVDYNIETKYEMWFDDDFYIRLGFSLNYDNQPAEGASDMDYVFQTGFGWEW